MGTDKSFANLAHSVATAVRGAKTVTSRAKRHDGFVGIVSLADVGDLISRSRTRAGTDECYAIIDSDRDRWHRDDDDAAWLELANSIAQPANQAEVRELRLRVASLEHQLTHRLSAVEAQVRAGTRRSVADSAATTEPAVRIAAVDPALTYFERRPAEREAYAGKHVAIHREDGIIAHGDSFGDVYAKVKELGQVEQVVFDVVAG